MKVTWKNSKKRSLPAVSNFSNLCLSFKRRTWLLIKIVLVCRATEMPKSVILTLTNPKTGSFFFCNFNCVLDFGGHIFWLIFTQSVIDSVLNMLTHCFCLAGATELQPSWAEAWVTLGRAQLNFGEPDRSIKSFDRALSIKPDCKDAQEDRKTAFRLVKRRKQLHTAGLSNTKNRYAVGDKDESP